MTLLNGPLTEFGRSLATIEQHLPGFIVSNPAYKALLLLVKQVR